MATVTWDSGQTSKGQASEVSYTYTNSNFATQLNTIPPYAIINSVKITAKFQVNLYTNNGGLTVGSKTWTVGDTNNHDWITIVENEDITSYLTGGSGTENAGALPNITVYASKRSGLIRTFKTQVTITWDYTETYTINVNASPEIGGMVNPTQISLIKFGETEEIEAIPYEGYKFVKWDDGNTDNPRKITVTGNATYTACFEKLPPEFTSAEMIYLNKQISQTNKVPCGESFIISVCIN